MNFRKKIVLNFAIISVLCTGLSFTAFAKDSLEAKFSKGGLEYHFLLNDTINVAPEFMSNLPAQIVEQLAPLFVIERKGKFATAMYVDTKDRVLGKKNLILRLKSKKITVKARGNSADSVEDLKKCSKKKYEIDYYGTAGYSISSDVKFKKEEFDSSFANVTPDKLLTFLESKCPQVYSNVAFLSGNPNVRIPGAAHTYKFKAALKEGNPLADKLEVDFAIWFFPPTDRTVIELSYSGPAADKAELDKLQAETFELLKSKGLLNPLQISKTNYFFNTFFRK